jgi:nucleoside-diphosphate-sugar epimerase
MSEVAAITGIGGFIGRRIAEALRDLGMTVRGVDIDERAAKRARDLGFDASVGDICDRDAMRIMCEGASVVVHTAAILGEAGAWDLYRRVNVEGTRTVIESAREGGARRVVHLSSVMVYGFDYPPNVTEDGPLSGENNPYCQTKIESEEAALELHRRGGTDVVILRPGDVYGPGSIPWIVRPLTMMNKRLFVLPDGGRGIINHLYVDNLCDAVSLAIEPTRAVGGDVFNVTDGGFTTFNTFFNELARWAHVGWYPKLPGSLLRPAFTLLDKAARRLGIESPAHPNAVDFLSRPHAVSIEKARARLGYSPRITLEEGFATTHAWALREGLVR